MPTSRSRRSSKIARCPGLCSQPVTILASEPSGGALQPSVSASRPPLTPSRSIQTQNLPCSKTPLETIASVWLRAARTRRWSTCSGARPCDARARLTRAVSADSLEVSRVEDEADASARGYATAAVAAQVASATQIVGIVRSRGAPFPIAAPHWLLALSRPVSCETQTIVHTNKSVSGTHKKAAAGHEESARGRRPSLWSPSRAEYEQLRAAGLPHDRGGGRPRPDPRVPKVGIEPTLPEGNRILSPARLPVPPLRRVPSRS